MHEASKRSVEECCGHGRGSNQQQRHHQTHAPLLKRHRAEALRMDASHLTDRRRSPHGRGYTLRQFQHDRGHAAQYCQREHRADAVSDPALDQISSILES